MFLDDSPKAECRLIHLPTTRHPKCGYAVVSPNGSCLSPRRGSANNLQYRYSSFSSSLNLLCLPSWVFCCHCRCRWPLSCKP